MSSMQQHRSFYLLPEGVVQELADRHGVKIDDYPLRISKYAKVAIGVSVATAAAYLAKSFFSGTQTDNPGVVPEQPDIPGSVDKGIQAPQKGSWLEEHVPFLKKFTQSKPAEAIQAPAPTANIPADLKQYSLAKANAVEREKFDFGPNYTKLSTEGRYTKEEADTIYTLKKSGTNTSASLVSGPDPKIVQMIRSMALKYGLDPEEFLQTALYESGGNPYAVSATGAIGLFQFVGRTASAVGITNRFDPVQNAEGAAILTLQNSKMAGTQDATTLYIFHQLGPAAAKEVLSARQDKKIAKLSSRARSALARNAGGNQETVGDYLSFTEQNLNRKYQKYIQAEAKANRVAATKPIPQSFEPPKRTVAVEVPAEATHSVGYSMESGVQPQQSGQQPQRVYKTKQGLLVAAN